MHEYVRHRVVSPACITERTASHEIRLKLQHASGLRRGRQHLIAEAPNIRVEFFYRGRSLCANIGFWINRYRNVVLCQNSALLK